MSGSQCEYKVLPHAKDDDETCCHRLICWNGCIWCCLFALYFFIVIPIGVLMIFHGKSKGKGGVVGGGAAVLIIPTFVLPGLFCLIRRWRSKYLKSRASIKAKKQGDLNPIVPSDEHDVEEELP